MKKFLGGGKRYSTVENTEDGDDEAVLVQKNTK